MDWPPLLHEERVLADDNLALYRQVSPSWVVDGKITSQAFKPMPKDNEMLSVRQSTVMSASDAYHSHTELGYESMGTYQVTVGDVETAGLRAVDDSRLDSAVLGHAYIDFRGVASRSIERAAKELRTCAMRYGVQFDPSSPSS